MNRIGKPRARMDDKGNEQIDVTSSHSFAYVDRQTFATTNGSYTNLIYRIHFEKTPFSLFPFHITAGNNNGLLTVVTLNAKNRPVLITTVHTCGCFLAIVPTSYLPASAYPKDWNNDSQWIYGMTLPAQLKLPKSFERLLVSWWSLDWRVGEDKAFRNKDETGTVFYTSLKPWNRQASDMWPFAGFFSVLGLEIVSPPTPF